MNAFVTDDVTHCRPLGENVDCKPKYKQCHFKFTLETMSLSLFLILTTLFYHISIFALQEHCHSICLDTGIDYRKRKGKSSERLYYM